MQTTHIGFLPGLGAVALTIFLCCFALIPEAGAHARLVRSVPAKGAEVSATPDRIDLWFNELLDDGFNTVLVFPAAELASKLHTSLVREKPVVDPKDRTHLSVKLPVLPAGEYVAEWRVLSRDGHSALGRFTFRISTR
jgi:methionine-rich copper-binding protein CopC